MLDLLIVIAIVIPGWYAYKRSVSHGLVAINHVTTFTFGFLLYWISPVIIGFFGTQLAPKLGPTYFRLFDQRLLTTYLTVCLGLYICFLVGDSLGRSLFVSMTSRSPQVPRLALSIVTATGVVLAVYTWLLRRDELLLPYGPYNITGTARGTLTSCVMLLGVVALLYMIDRPTLSWRVTILNRYFITFAAGSVLLLRLGSRLYVASFVLMFVVYHCNFRRRLKIRPVIVGVIVFGLVLGAISLWRERDQVTEHPLTLFMNLLAEPAFVSLSLVYYLRFEGIAVINNPVYLLSDFTNLIPALLLPGKASLRMRAPVFMPIGGLNSFVSFNMNFGVLGSAVILFLLPMGFLYLKSRMSETLFATMYVMCTSWMAFTFFRDPFYISIVKAIVQDSILMPVAVVAFGSLLAGARLSSADVSRLLGESLDR
jgi:hypothetical protein